MFYRHNNFFFFQILLLEAGDEEPVIADIPGLSASFVTRSNIDYGYLTEPEPAGNFVGKKTRFPYPRGKVMGGTSSINGMIYNRGNKQDYNDWAKLGNKGWSWDDVLPFFIKSEDAQDPWVFIIIQFLIAIIRCIKPLNADHNRYFTPS